ncbi:unnamed protein product [Thelazia callipaeda]|uniref:Succinate dehydrogenase [ubiquinone] cytochrome b small subunit n=1 Tax=Thelazia callipaeda TaxID=103827 RepID=A0A0N5CV99_THECL|nr:unnamed protein product [Thelazia callipaeda]
MLSATIRRTALVSSRLVYPRLMQRSVAGLIPELPQFDPIVARKQFKETHDHSTLFKVERYCVAGMLPLLPASYFVHGPLMDAALAVSIALHVHWGMQGLFSDYARPFVLGPALAKVVQGPLVYVLSISLLAGLLHFNSYDVGITKAFEMIWSL